MNWEALVYAVVVVLVVLLLVALWRLANDRSDPLP
jgi:hypothetical protein